VIGVTVPLDVSRVSCLLAVLLGFIVLLAVLEEAIASGIVVSADLLRVE
jgi:hypothetical protein